MDALVLLARRLPSKHLPSLTHVADHKYVAVQTCAETQQVLLCHDRLQPKYDTLRALNSSVGKGVRLSSRARDPPWSPLSLLFSGYRGSFPQLKWPRRETNHSSPSSAEVQNEWSYTSTAPTRLHGEHRNKNKVLQFLHSERMRTWARS